MKQKISASDAVKTTNYAFVNFLGRQFVDEAIAGLVIKRWNLKMRFQE